MSYNPIFASRILLEVIMFQKPDKSVERFRCTYKSKTLESNKSQGKLSSVTKLTGKDDLIREYLEKKIPQSVIARLLNVHRLTVRSYIHNRKLQKPATQKL